MKPETATVTNTKQKHPGWRTALPHEIIRGGDRISFGEGPNREYIYADRHTGKTVASVAPRIIRTRRVLTKEVSP